MARLLRDLGNDEGAAIALDFADTRAKAEGDDALAALVAYEQAHP